MTRAWFGCTRLWTAVTADRELGLRRPTVLLAARSARVSAPSSPVARLPARPPVAGWVRSRRCARALSLPPRADPSPPPPTMACSPARTSAGRGPRLLPLLALLLVLLRDAGCGYSAPARSNQPAAADGPAGIEDPQRSLEDVAAAPGAGAQDMVTMHMLRLYEKYSRRGARPGGGNTVRSFRAQLGKWRRPQGFLLLILPLSHLFILSPLHLHFSSVY